MLSALRSFAILFGIILGAWALILGPALIIIKLTIIVMGWDA